jgi:hypothetical protein
MISFLVQVTNFTMDKDLLKTSLQSKTLQHFVVQLNDWIRYPIMSPDFERIWIILYMTEGASHLCNIVFDILLDQFKQSLISDIHNSSKGIDIWFLCCKFRTGNVSLPMETERWKDILRENFVKCVKIICDEYIFFCLVEFVIFF